MANILSLSNTTGTPTSVPIAASPATLITYALGENNYQAVELVTTILMSTTAGSTVQDIVFEYKAGAVVLETITKKTPAVALVSDNLIPIDLMAKVNSKQTLTLTVKAAAADATVICTVQNTYILAHY